MGIGGSVLNILTKSVGAAAAGLVIYDAHNAGKIKAPMYEKNHKAGQLSERYLDDMKLDSPSVVKAAAKKRIFKYFLDENLSDFFVSTAGYFKGFGSMLVDNAIPLVLAAGTFLKGKGVRGVVSKSCGVGLLAYGGIFLLKEVFGMGKAKE